MRKFIKNGIISCGCLAAGVGLVGLVYVLPYFIGREK